MARGVDGMGHRGALLGNGKTFAVLGCGVDVC
ncbi:MAG: DNA-processing protein DprA [Anaerobutyricum sp.]